MIDLLHSRYRNAHGNIKPSMCLPSKHLQT